MNLVFADNHSVDDLTLKKLVLVGSTLNFVNRPSILIANNTGTIGEVSNLTGFESLFSNDAVQINVINPPDTMFNSNFYKEYFDIDQNIIEFRKSIIEGIRNGSNSFWLLDSHGAKTNSVQSYPTLKDWIINNQELLLDTDLSQLKTEDDQEFFALDSLDDAIRGFRTTLWEESLQTTTTLYGCTFASASPVSLSQNLDNLIKIRLSNKDYYPNAKPSKNLGLNIIESIISDAALNVIELREIFEFRERIDIYYKNYIIELNKLESELLHEGEGIDPNYVLDTKIIPELRRLKNEMTKIRDDKFKRYLELLNKGVYSIIAASSLSFIGIGAAILGFVVSHLKSPVITQGIIDDYFKIRDVQRNSYLTYIMKLEKFAK